MRSTLAALTVMAAGVAGAACGGCAAPAGHDDARHARIVDTLAEDNYVWARRDPALVARKLHKLQRGPYEWLRGTGALFWRDVMEPGVSRYATSFGDPASSRVLLVGDPHPENAGTFRAADGTMIVDWNDFDASGYGPFTGDLRRLGAGLAIIARLGAPGNDALRERVVAQACSSYAATIATLAAGDTVPPVGVGAQALLDKQLAKGLARGDVLFAVDELAPVGDGVRQLALGDLEAVAADDVIEDRVEGVDADSDVMVRTAIGHWAPGHLAPASAVVKLVARRIGSGVASYAALRFDAILEGETLALDDDRIIELKETRDGVIIRGTPQREASEWPSAAARVADTQRRLQQRPDADALLGSAVAGGIALKIRDREAYQRGIDAVDLEALAGGSDSKQQQLLDLAAIYGRLLACSHGRARTDDDRAGVAVIGPLLAGRVEAFTDELTEAALADADQIEADYAASADLILDAEVLP